MGLEIWRSSFACPLGRPKSPRRRHSPWLALFVRKIEPRSWGAKPAGPKAVQLAAVEAARSSSRGSGGRGAQWLGPCLRECRAAESRQVRPGEAQDF